MTFVELLVGMAILTAVLSCTLSLFVSAMRSYSKAQVESDLYREGVYVMEMIQRGEDGLFGIMKARSDTLAVSAGSDSVTFSVDKNADYTEATADDIPMSISFDNGDGNDDTLEDNAIEIDPNTNVAGNELYVGHYLESVTFSLNGDVVTVNLSLSGTFRDEPVRLSLSRDILMRN